MYVTMTRPDYHTMPIRQPITRQPVIIERVAADRPVEPTTSGSATDLAAQGARNCWDPRTWGIEIAPVAPMVIGIPQ